MTFLPVHFVSGELHASLGQLPQHAMFDQFEVPATETGETNRRGNVWRGRRRHLPDLDFGITRPMPPRSCLIDWR
jgi:hypothetical protein